MSKLIGLKLFSAKKQGVNAIFYFTAVRKPATMVNQNNDEMQENTVKQRVIIWALIDV